MILGYILRRYPPSAGDAPTTPKNQAQTPSNPSTASPDSAPRGGASASFNDVPYVISPEEDIDDEGLIETFDKDGTQGAQDILGFDRNGLEDDAEEEEWNLANDSEYSCKLLVQWNFGLKSDLLSLLGDFLKFQTETRVAAAKRSENTQHKGGIKTQLSTVKIWNVSCTLHSSRAGTTDVSVVISYF